MSRIKRRTRFRRALESYSDQQPHREHICHRAASNEENQRLPLPQDRPGDDLRPDDPSRDIASQYPVRQWSAKKKWRKLDGAFRLPEIIERVEFKDRIKQEKHAA